MVAPSPLTPVERDENGTHTSTTLVIYTLSWRVVPPTLTGGVYSGCLLTY